MTEYNDWIIWNATPDSKCPVPAGTMGQVQLAYQTRCEKESGKPQDDISEYSWRSARDASITAYRTVKEPPRPRRVEMRFSYNTMADEYEFGPAESSLGARGVVEVIEDIDGNVIKFTWTADE